MKKNSWLLAILVLLGFGAWRLIHVQTVSPSQLTGPNDIPAPARTSAFSTTEKGANGYSTFYNPRGSAVANITLSDGTRVWLNAGSSIRYPLDFPDYDRTVELNGEAYFEVAADAHRPFGVTMGKAIVRAQSTSFNIKANDQLWKVSLLQGEARITASNTLTLEAGQQAVVQERVELVKDVNLESVTDWKKGLFSFSHTDPISAMNELSRWYDVQVVYGSELPNKYFTGKLDRTLSLDQVLQTIGEGRLHYAIDPHKRQLTIN